MVGVTRWLIVRLQTKWLWVSIPLQSLKKAGLQPLFKKYGLEKAQRVEERGWGEINPQTPPLPPPTLPTPPIPQPFKG